MKDLIQKTIARLRRDNIKPLPKWRFAFVNVAYWALVALAVFFGTVAVSVGIYLLFQIDWAVARYAPGGTFRIFFLYIPYIWLFVIAILMGAVFYCIRKTRQGYKYKGIVIML
jgi:hypothetical protein